MIARQIQLRILSKKYLRNTRKLALFSGSCLAFAGASLIGGSLYTDMPISFFVNHCIRFVRSAFYVGVISVDYKWNFRNIERGHPDYRKTRKIVDKRTGERLLKLCKKNKSLYVKFAQHIASLNHVLPIEITGPLSELQDRAQSVPFDTVVDMFKSEFKKHPLEIFTKFEETPIASASLAQVHIAYLPNNQKCAVKVQYPNMETMFKSDFKTIEFLGNIVQRIFPNFSSFSFILPELKSIHNELNFINEGLNAEKSKKMFKGNRNVHIPDVYWDYTTKKILTMEFVDGIKINDLSKLEKEGIKADEAAKILIEIFSTQLFIHGFVHSDLHPGNLLARKKNNRLQIVLLDHGLYKELPEDIRINYCHLWKAMVLRDYKKIKYYSSKLGVNNHHELFAAMLTYRPPNKDVGFRHNVTPEDVKKMKALLGTNPFETINEVIGSVPRDLLFIFKTTNLVRSINKDLGANVNRFLIMARYGVKGIDITYKPTSILSLCKHWFNRIRFEITLFAYSLLERFRLFITDGNNNNN